MRGVGRVWPQSKRIDFSNVCSVETASVEATAYDAVAADIDGGEGGLNARGIIAQRLRAHDHSKLLRIGDVHEQWALHRPNGRVPDILGSLRRDGLWLSWWKPWKRRLASRWRRKPGMRGVEAVEEVGHGLEKQKLSLLAFAGA